MFKHNHLQYTLIKFTIQKHVNLLKMNLLITKMLFNNGLGVCLCALI